LSNALDVYLHGDRAGALERRSSARLRFAYAPDWVEGESTAISLSLPVRERAYDHAECAPFFEGLLPEGDFLKAISRTLHVSARNPFQLLAEIGGECAGAISVGAVGGPAPGRADARRVGWRTRSWAGCSATSRTGHCWVRSTRRTDFASRSPGPKTRSVSYSMANGSAPPSERIPIAFEDARRELPIAFQDRPVLDRIGEVVAERAGRLRKALAEPADN
jgi:HipA-like protein